MLFAGVQLWAVGQLEDIGPVVEVEHAGERVRGGIIGAELDGRSR